MIYLLLSFLSSIAFAQTEMPQMGKPHRRDQPAQESPRVASKKRADEVSGQCVVLPGGGNLIASPCPEVILTLQGKGDPIQTRTDRMGMYEFATEVGAEYKVLSGSKFYDVVEPTKPVHSGQRIEIHLKQKN